MTEPTYYGKTIDQWITQYSEKYPDKPYNMRNYGFLSDAELAEILKEAIEKGEAISDEKWDEIYYVPPGVDT